MGKTKGLFLKGYVDMLRKQKGPEAIEKLKTMMDGEINFSQLKSYPMEIEIKLKDSIIKILYGKITDEAELEFGKLSFQVYADSVLGKTMFSLFGNNLKKLSLSVSRVLDSVVEGITFETEELGEKKVLIRITDNVHNIRHYEGVWLAAIKYFGHQGAVKAVDKGNNVHEYVLSWE